MPPRKKTPKGPVPVEATVHADQRANLPTADAQEFVTPEVEAIPKLRYPRDPSLDPQLIWKGKDEQDNDDLEVDAPPIYIQEKIDPRVLIENLRRTATDGETEPELTLFETFDGLSELDLVDFYRHEANWSNRMVLGDSLQVMASLAERESLRGKVQMIYIDPPYGIKFGSNWQVSARVRDVKDGKLEDASREVEMIRAFRDTWELGIHSYLSYMRDRLAVCRDLLTQTGSIFVQIGDENVHLVRAVLDTGDLVFDPTCGSGTTAYVSEQWGRRWITIDTSRVALALARQRLMGAKYPYYLLADSEDGRRKEEELTGQQISSSPATNDIRRGFVFERVQHITLKSIANNPDIKEGMTREEVAAAIVRHAEYEQLSDRPVEDKKKVRVTGPFTVESLSPHRSLAFASPGEGTLPASEQQAAQDPSAPSFEQTIIENLRKAGIQNGKRNERLMFDLVESHAGAYIQAVGSREDSESGPGRIAIAIGPQYGTVGPTYIKDAAREAIRAKDVDLLCVLGFAFDPQAIGASEDYVADTKDFASVAAERSLGRVPVLLVRMNADLVMGDDLKKTGAGNLFTVFGEPDIKIREEHDGVVVESHR
jgi:hypothetical protein